nr:ATPase [Sulfurospirillum sp.]
NLELVENDEARELMEKLNKYIGENLGEDYMLGHSYFMGKDINLEFIKKYKIKPLLEEYFYADEEKLKEILNLHM